MRDELKQYINKVMSTQWSRGNRVFPTPCEEDVEKVCSDIIGIVRKTIMEIIKKED
jgi:hypothetical protein